MDLGMHVMTMARLKNKQRPTLEQASRLDSRLHADGVLLEIAARDRLGDFPSPPPELPGKSMEEERIFLMESIQRDMERISKEMMLWSSTGKR